MRTTVDIPQPLIEEALKVSHAKTKTMVLILGLQELINRHKLNQLRDLKGKVAITTDLLRSRKR